jgi:hypothetical protein
VLFRRASLFNAQKALSVEFAGKGRQNHGRVSNFRNILRSIRRNSIPEPVVGLVEFGCVLKYLARIKICFATLGHVVARLKGAPRHLFSGVQGPAHPGSIDLALRLQLQQLLSTFLHSFLPDQWLRAEDSHSSSLFRPGYDPNFPGCPHGPLSVL